MGAIGSMLGTAGGAGGTGFAGPSQAGLQHPVTADQANAAYAGTQQGIDAQQKLLAALQGANGLKDQSNVFLQQQNLANQLAAANGVGNQSAALKAQQQLAQQQQGLVGQYQDIASGRGPNPAAAMLNQATGQNVANQAALMAGQRGAGANVGLMARQAAQQGAATQQQAAGQAAVMQANQQLNALGQIGAQQQAIGNTNQNVAGIAAQQLAAQQGQQGALAGMANQEVANQMAGTNMYNQAQQGLYGTVLGGINAQNSADISNQASINAANAGLASSRMGQQGSMVGGVLNGAAAVAGLARGGEIHKMADGGVAAPTVAPMSGPQSSWGKFAMGVNNAFVDPNKNDVLYKGASSLGPALANIFKSSPSQKPETPMGTMSVGTPGNVLDNNMSTGQAIPSGFNSNFSSGGLASNGGRVNVKAPEQKAEKSGDSYNNDKVPAMLSEGEIVIPRSISMHPDAPKLAMQFVADTIAKRGKK